MARNATDAALWNATTEQTITAPAAPGNNSVDAATKIINSFMPWLLIIAGSVFNFLIILGMRTKEFRGLSTSLYMTAGAVNDLLGLLIALTTHWVYVNFPTSIVRGGRADILCRFFNFYGWGQADVGIAIITAMTADRAYGILRPLRTANPVWRAKVTIAAVIGVCVVKDLHFWVASDIVPLERSRERMCDVFPQTESYRRFYRDAWPWIHASFLTVCFVVMVTSNSIIIHEVHTRPGVSSGSVRTNSVKEGEGKGKKSAQPDPRASNTMTIHNSNYDQYARHVTSMLLAESFTLILLTFPFSVHLVVSSQLSGLDTDPEKQRANTLAFSVVFYLIYANKCVTFLVYCLSGRRFRRAIVSRVLCVKWRWSQQHSRSASQNGHRPSQRDLQETAMTNSV